MDLVVARFNENVDWLEEIPVNRIFVYNKGKDLPTLPDNGIYCQLPNWGRESDTYLNHIIAHYHDLPDFTIFVQGHPFDHLKMGIKKLSANMLEYIEENKAKGFVPFCGTWDWVANHHVAADWDRYLWYHGMMEVFEVLFGEKALPIKSEAIWGAQFGATRETLQRFTLNQYQKIKLISDKYEYIPWGFEKYWMYMYTKNAVQFSQDKKIRSQWLA